MTKPLPMTENDIEVRIVPTVLRWPSRDTAKTIAWDRARECVDSFRGVLRAVDAHCTKAEQNADLSPAGIARQRAAVGQQALAELDSFKPFQLAEKAVAENIRYLEDKMTALPQPPTSFADALLAQEIRQDIKQSRHGQKTPLDVDAVVSDRRILGAVLNAPARLSGLTETELNVVREKARIALHPDQHQLQQHLRKAVDDLREGLNATRRAVRERCELPEPLKHPLPPTNEAGSSGSSWMKELNGQNVV
jgi:hypothetical protein